MGAAILWHLQQLWFCLSVLPGLGRHLYKVLEVPSVTTTVPGVLGWCFSLTSDTVTGSKIRFVFHSLVETLKPNWDQSSSAQTAETAAADILIYLYSCAYDHTTPSTTGRWMLRAGKIRGQSQMPSPHSSFSGSCCSLPLTTQHRAQPELDAARDGTILVCVGVGEGRMVTGWVGSLCSVCWRPAGGSVPQTRLTTGGVLSGVTRLQRSAKIRNLNCPDIYNVEIKLNFPMSESKECLCQPTI